MDKVFPDYLLEEQERECLQVLVVFFAVVEYLKENLNFLSCELNGKVIKLTSLYGRG
jgi:hypothetical protein